MTLERITDSRHPDAERLIALHRETFPEYERFRDTPLMANMIDHIPAVHFNAVYEDGELAGFLIYWDLDDCYYVHFIAVFPQMRGRQTGQKILDWLAVNMRKPVFMEVEIPYDEITGRRLGFYKRNGYMELADDPATLSDVRLGGHPLWLMGSRTVDDLEHYLVKIRDVVYYAEVK